MFESSVFCLLLLPRKQQQFFDTFFRGGISLLVLFSNIVKEKKRKHMGEILDVFGRMIFGHLRRQKYPQVRKINESARQKKDTVQ